MPMKKKCALLLAATVSAADAAHGSGYRIPEQSINAVALSNACIAHTDGPDAAFYNPANMGWQDDRWQLEASFSYINLPHIDYTDSRSPALDGSSATEDIFIPMLHAVSRDYANFRFGFSFLVPFGLSKQWDEPFPARTAREFTLNVYEANPSISYRFGERLGLAAGARLLHTGGNTVRTSGALDLGGAPPVTATLGSRMDGDSTDPGYNLALTFKPAQPWSIGVTYRSRVKMALRGTATLTSALAAGDIPLGTALYHGDVQLDLVMPAVLAAGVSRTFGATTVELAWDRTYWSAYETLDFDFNGGPTDPLLIAAFDTPQDKNWHDTNAYHLGITHRCTDRFTAMAGFAYDESPMPDRTLGFELPDADSRLYSFGGRYQVNDNLTLAGAYLREDKKAVTIDPANGSGIRGRFTDGGAHVVTLGVVYSF
jgi:long-chain fatty acid transport protein